MTPAESYCELLDRYYKAIQEDHWEDKLGELNQETDRLTGLTCRADECKCGRRRWPKIDDAGRKQIELYQRECYNRLVGGHG